MLAVKHPELAKTYAVDFGNKVRDLLSRGEVVKLADYIYTEAGGQSFYIPHLKQKNNTTELEIQVHGNKMLVPLLDSGISYELLIHGQHEQKATEQFSKYLTKINAETEQTTVVEIGANLGYYLLQEAELLDSNSVIHAYEPVPYNSKVLKENIERNRIENQVEFAELAASAYRGQIEMRIDLEPNRAHVNVDRRENHNSGRILKEPELIPVESWSVDGYFQKHGFQEDSVNVIRMDVEGYEYEVLRGMNGILKKSAPILLFFEFHPAHLRATNQLQPLLENFRNNNFQLLSAVRRHSELNINSISELRTLTGAPNIFLYKPG